MKPIEALKQYREQEGFTIEELVAVANSLLEQWAPIQPRYKVVPFPDVRTVRFYTAHRLIDPPARRRGNRVLYDYHHLLQLVTLKTLQAQYIPLRAVRRMIEGKTDTELEQLIDSVLEQRSDAALAKQMGEAAKAMIAETAVVYAPVTAGRSTESPYPTPTEVHQFVLSSWAVLTVDPKAARNANVTEINRIADMVRLSLQKAYHEPSESESKPATPKGKARA
ncbi:MAG: MerR family transcriptional regulator [Fimbriimonadales bacterium]|nr:MerR family transcriptional regulator [Fimbriimonadales bacterium]